MKITKRILKTLTIFFPVISLAQVENTFPDIIPKKTVSQLLNLIINALLGIIGTIAVLFIIIGGFQYITSAGNPDSIMKAKNTILYAVLGLIFAILAYAIINFIITNL